MKEAISRKKDVSLVFIPASVEEGIAVMVEMCLRVLDGFGIWL